MNTVVLVDTSYWITYLTQGTSPACDRLDSLIETDRAAVCAPIRAEILSGAKDEKDYAKLTDWFMTLHDLPAPNNIWDRIARARFLLARKGIQTSIVDLWIAVIAEEHNVPLWTPDNDFTRIAHVIPIRLT